jgi:hypothetical protein
METHWRAFPRVIRLPVASSVIDPSILLCFNPFTIRSTSQLFKMDDSNHDNIDESHHSDCEIENAPLPPKRVFIEVSRRSSDPSSVWYYFRKDVIKEIARCGECKSKKTLISCRGSTTTGMSEHLKRIHNIDLKSLRSKKRK